MPSSFCGLFGLRPSHGRIPVTGLMTQSPSFDTVGYFARDPASFAKVGWVLLGEPIDEVLPSEIVIATDCFAIAEDPVRAALAGAVERLSALVPTSHAPLAAGDLLDWSRHQRVLQQSEFHATFRYWIDRVNPRFSAEVAGAFANDGRIPPDDLAAAKAFRAKATARIEALLDGRRLLCLPTSLILPIRRNARLSEIRTAVHRIVDLTAIAGLAGLPQINLPLGFAGQIPVGLSVIGWRNGDAQLVGAACAIMRELAAYRSRDRP